MEYINFLYPGGANSTLFTSCCSCAISNDQKRCPQCKELVIGYDADSEGGRGRIRWNYATSHWKRVAERGGFGREELVKLLRRSE